MQRGRRREATCSIWRYLHDFLFQGFYVCQKNPKKCYVAAQSVLFEIFSLLHVVFLTFLLCCGDSASKSYQMFKSDCHRGMALMF